MESEIIFHSDTEIAAAGAAAASAAASVETTTKPVAKQAQQQKQQQLQQQQHPCLNERLILIRFNLISVSLICVPFFNFARGGATTSIIPPFF